MSEIVRLHQHNVNRGPLHEGESGLPTLQPVSPKVRLIAFYLPQFHTFAENDAWWGKGFTEWTNTSKAIPRFQGHYQPRLPADLGFYDLSQPEVLRKQAALAKRAGIHGFCIHNYWFSGRTVMETPLEALLADRSIDLPFCLNWANESWSRRWDGAEHDILLAQEYAPGDAEAYAAYLLRAIADPRYIRIDGRPLVMVYRPDAMPDAQNVMDIWRRCFLAAGEKEPYLVMVRSFGSSDPRPHGIEAAAVFPPHRPGPQLTNEKRWVKLYDRNYYGRPVRYENVAADALAQQSDDYLLFPAVVPNWDNEARKPGKGYSLFGSTPAAYGAWLEAACLQAMAREKADERIVFVNAWNEWAEGAYLEPDRHFGFAYLNETRRVIDRLSGVGHAAQSPAASSQMNESSAFQTQRRFVHLLRNLPMLVKHKYFKRA